MFRNQFAQNNLKNVRAFQCGSIHGVQLDSYLLYSSNYFDIEALVLVFNSANESPPDVFSFWNFGQKGEKCAMVEKNLKNSCTHIQPQLGKKCVSLHKII